MPKPISGGASRTLQVLVRRANNSNTTCGDFTGYSGTTSHNIVCNGGVPAIGRYVTLQLTGFNASLGVCEILVSSQAVEPVSDKHH